jgi:sodium pump decarboxylase gamma subunit
MKKINLKRFSLLLCLIACMFTLTACAEQISSDDVKLMNKTPQLSEVESNIEKWSIDVVTYLSNSTDDKIRADAEDALNLSDITGSYYIVNQDGINTATVGLYNTWINIRSDLGELVSLDNGTIQLSTDTGTLCTVSIEATYEKRKCSFELTFDDDCNLTSGAVNPTYTTGEKGKKAVLNTVIGMGTVFVVLIFISFIISLFKYIPIIEEKLTGKGKAAQAANGVDNAIAQIVSNEENEADDLELVAVIAAAIAASEGTSPDGLVVRSIIKRS